MEDLSGRTLGPYQLYERLGRGGMGSVYRAVHTKIGKKVALKVLHPEHAEHPEILERFIAEAQAVNAIGHQNIVDIGDISEGGNGEPVYLVMELLEGQVLRDALDASGSFPADRAVRIALQVASALQATHNVGIVHRDLKPDNVFLTTRAGHVDFVVLLDFGIAKLGDGLSFKTRTGTMIGTPQYMSPEQTEGAGVGPRTDVYALGVMLYEMLAGRVPFDGDSVPAILKKIWMDDPVPLGELRPDLPAGMADLVMKAFTREVGDRTRSMQELIDALSAVMPDVGRNTASLLTHEKPEVAAARAASEAATRPGSLAAINDRETVESAVTMAQAAPAAGSVSSLVTPAAMVGEAAPVASALPSGGGSKLPYVVAAIGMLCLLGGAGFFFASQGDLGGADDGEEISAVEDRDRGSTDSPDRADDEDRDRDGDRDGDTDGEGAGEAKEDPESVAATDGDGAESASASPAAGPGNLDGESHERDTARTGGSGAGGATVPFDPKVLKSRFLAKHGKPMHKCFHEFDGMHAAGVAFEVTPAGKIDHYEYGRISAADFEHQRVLVKCLDKVFKKASFPRTREGGHFELYFEKDKLGAAPLHMKKEEMNPLAMKAYAMTHAKGALTACFEKHKHKAMSMWGRIDADGKVTETGRSFSHGYEADAVQACLDAALRRITFPESRAGGRFTIDLRREKLGLAPIED